MSVVIHAHVYQPPREHPLTGDTPVEPTAAPHHDWNFRITHECYRPMGAAQILRADGEPEKSLNLYAWLNFNVGPTLAIWLDRFAPDVMAAMQAGDAASSARHGGHGGAIAQPFVHAIMPLASARDRATLVRWGIADFVSRFGRRPQGMWLPETAVDTATLETLAAAGIQYTIVAPHQVLDVDNKRQAVRVELPSGQSIAVFPYDGSLAHRVAFGELLRSGAEMAEAFTVDVGESGLISIATDAETFGHHHKFSEMALAFAVDALHDDMTTYGAWLRDQPQSETAQIRENSSWSCEHGIERWRSDCGCKAGIGTDPDQEWRAPLREAMSWLIAAIVDATDEQALEALREPWVARDEYVEVLIGAEPLSEFVIHHAVPGCDEQAAMWLELHRHLLLAQSSCAWFFDDADGHEVELSLRHADVAMAQLAQLTGVDLSAEFSERLGERFSSRVPLTPT